MAAPDNLQRMSSKGSKGKSKQGKPTLSREEAERVRTHVERFLARFGGNESLAAATLGISQPAFNKWVSGTSAPGINQLDELARHLDTTEYHLRKGTVADLDVAIQYQGIERWSPSAIARARQMAEDMAAKGETMSPQSWVATLDQLGKR